uniref:Uncharacterized protein n=1 Tax=Moniliophthora roreri TaxID=221103 RepID=A0A0W0EW73_MONRR
MFSCPNRATFPTTFSHPHFPLKNGPLSLLRNLLPRYTKRASIGHMFYRYVDGFLSCLKCYVENFDEDDITHFNEAVTQSKFQVHINPLEHKAPPTINCEIKDRVFNILFRQEKLGYSQG